MKSQILFKKTLKNNKKLLNRSFTTTKNLAINSKNGLKLDRSQEIADSFHGDKKAIENYFAEKEQSIRESHRADSNSAAADGVGVEELRGWMQRRDDLLTELESQVDDVMDLASVPVSESSSEHDNMSDDNSSSNNSSVDQGNNPDSDHDMNQGDNQDSDHDMDQSDSQDSDTDADQSNSQDSNNDAGQSNNPDSDNNKGGSSKIGLPSDGNTSSESNNIPTSSYFKQDSSDIFPTDFPPFEPGDD